jgi:diadenosine tetraphosphate (Ap4A) HIT family hydrolase
LIFSIGTIEYEDHRYVVFRTTGRVTEHHYLVTPRKHIKNLKYVKGEEGAKLLYNLKQIGKKVIHEKTNDKAVVQGAKYSFHIPPYNSIDHLHLHVIGKPETMSVFNWLKYPTTRDVFYCQNVDTVINQLSPTFFDSIAKEKSEGELFDDISEEFEDKIEK